MSRTSRPVARAAATASRLMSDPLTSDSRPTWTSSRASELLRGRGGRTEDGPRTPLWTTRVRRASGAMAETRASRVATLFATTRRHISSGADRAARKAQG